MAPLGRWCDLNGESPVDDLVEGMDFRHPRYRREVFLRFYEFHTKYNAHPGCVYFLMPWLAEKFGWDQEAKLWYAFLNGNSQHPITSYEIFKRFPEVPRGSALDDFKAWVEANYDRLGWDTDRRYHRKMLVRSVACYSGLLAGGSQEDYFGKHCDSDRRANFRRLWKTISKKFMSFGRLSTFSYMEYLRIMGVPVDCAHLFLEDMSGSKSHRNGICKVLGRDDLDWHQSNPNFKGDYYPAMVEWLGEECDILLEEARARMPGDETVSLFTLESALCTYKGWHRVNRRYPNVYNDMFRDRILDSERRWEKPMTLWWDARRENLPEYLRVEDVPGDPGLAKTKQNHYRITGQVIMMDRDWPCFRNDFNESIKALSK